YCRMLMLARDLGKVNYLNQQKSQELLDLKAKWGWSDPRLAPGMENCDICANDIFRESWKSAGIERKAFEAPPAMSKHPVAEAMATGEASPSAKTLTVGDIQSDQESLVRLITDRVIAELSNR